MKHLFWLIPLLLLVAWSLLQQARRPATVGEQVVMALKATPLAPRLRGGLPIVEGSASPGKIAMHLARITGTGPGKELWEGTCSGRRFWLARSLDGPALGRTLLEEAPWREMERALRRAGVPVRVAQEAVAAARQRWLGCPDETLFLALIQADQALLERSTTPAEAAARAILLMAWNPRGAVACLTRPTGKLYMVETQSDTTPDEWRLILVNMGTDGAEQWHGMLRVRRPPNDPPNSPALLDEALRQMEPQQSAEH